MHHELTPFLPGGGSGVRLAADGPGGPCLGGLRMPDGLEGGTPDLPGISALGAAMDFIDGVGLEPIAAHNQALTRFLVERLAGLPGGVAAARPGLGRVPGRLRDRLVPGRRGAQRRRRVRAELPGFYVRTGSHCMAGGQYDDSVRVSVHAYNAGYEVERFTAFLALIAEGTL